MPYDDVGEFIMRMLAIGQAELELIHPRSFASLRMTVLRDEGGMQGKGVKYIMLGILVSGVTNVAEMRLMLFVLLMVAVGLLLAGSIIALMTLRNQRRIGLMNVTSERL